MVKLSDVARIMLDGMDTRVDESSSLPEQAALVYEAARRFARAQGFPEVNYLNQYPGYEGPLVMKRLVTDLFPHANREKLDAISSSVNQVLRRSVAARCTHRPAPNEKSSSPVWFIALEPPANMADIALGAATLNHHPSPGQLTYAERRLTEHEAGEDREPAEVVISTAIIKESDQTELDRDNVIFEEVATSPLPVTVTELAEITGIQRWRVNTSVSRLVANGRLFSRMETEEEGLVRTGGNGKPRARRPRLFWPSEPVPTREALPSGAAVQRSSREWTDRRRELNRHDEQLILDYLVRPPAGGRSTGKISRAVDIEHHRTKRLLDSMTENGVLRLSKPAGLYYLATDPQRPRRPSSDNSLDVPVRPPVQTPEPVKEADPAGILEQFVASSVAARTAELEAELKTVKSERDALKARLQRIQEQFK